VESRQPRSHGPRQRPRRCGHKAYPTELPPLIRCAMKGMQYMCRCEAGYALGMLMPSTVKQSLPLSAQAYLHEGAAQVGTHNGIRRGGVDDGNMRNMARGKCLAMLGAHGNETCVVTQNVRFGQFRIFHKPNHHTKTFY